MLIIAEAGSNWRCGTRKRDLETAYKLIEAAAEAEADVVKFQMFRANTTYAKGAGSCEQLENMGITETIEEIFLDLELPDEFVPLLAEHCEKCGIELMISAFSERDFNVIDPYVKRHKIASFELHHPRFLELAAQSGKPTILSTGVSSLDEIAWAVEKFAGRELCLMHCISQYPAEPEAMNVACITDLQKRFGLPVGLSDHSRDPTVAPVMAVGLGAVVIEKHFTLSRRLSGPDHSWAIEPHELKELVRQGRLAERMRGSDKKAVFEQEKPLVAYARRSVQAMSKIKAGEILQWGVNIAILRPGQCAQGVHPMHIGKLLGKKATHDIEEGVGVREGDWE